MMNSSEECSSGCESGWTLYLEHSFLHGKQRQIDDEYQVEGEETDIEDLSMVSDASSGPPLYSHEDDDNNHYSSRETDSSSGFEKSKKHQMKNKKNKNKKKKVVEEQRQIHPNQVRGCNFLDDTASSPAFNHTSSIPHAMDYSQAFSATHFQQRGSGEYDEQFGYVQTSLSGNYLQNHQWL